MAETTVRPTPFRVSVPGAALEDLRQRLANTRFPGQLKDIGWDDGTEKTYLQVRPTEICICQPSNSSWGNHTTFDYSTSSL